MDIKNTAHNWLRIAFLNLLIVASLGVIMRYKISFSLPFIDQKHILHAHSHFAFAGWITQALMTFMVYYLSRKKGIGVFKKYKWLLLANLFTAYGMLFSFPFQGYGLFSITFSTLTIIVSYIFAVVYWRDLNRLGTVHISHYWFKAALLFSAISSAGAFSLSIMMASHSINQHLYLASIYFYLHFQYNGWFFFACVGLLFDLLKEFNTNKTKIIFWLYALACIPAYVLSALWLPIPEWVHAIVTIAALAQIVGLALLLHFVFKNIKAIKNKLATAKWILVLSLTALCIKLLLQLGSTVHVLSDLAFGFRPIVIGYLHLVLLGVITLFIIGYALSADLLHTNKKLLSGAIIFTCGIILNELLLMLQGVAALASQAIPYINEMLLFAALVMFSSILWLNIGAAAKISSGTSSKVN